MTTRREFLKLAALGGFGLFMPFKIDFSRFSTKALATFIATQDPTAIPKFKTPLVIPPAMPRTSKLKTKSGKSIDYYEIAVRQFMQQILPADMPATKVWGYGSVNHPGTFNYPSFTIEAKYNTPLKVKWINDLKDPITGEFIPHLLPSVDQTLHWANPPGGPGHTDSHGTSHDAYKGPVPIVTHVHGAHVGEESDGYAEAWFLPAASDIPDGYATSGTWYDTFAGKSFDSNGIAWEPGTSIFDYPNNQRAGTLWYHDHTLGMTRLNVYAGPAGFYLIRGGPDDLVIDTKTKKQAVLPGPAPALGDLAGISYFEIPLAIQDRCFNDDGSLFYPDSRAYFEGLSSAEQLQIPFYGKPTCTGGKSDISPIWNPEFFGNTMLVNGKTWPYLNVEAKRYRFRFLNGCNSRFLILQNDANLPFHVIGTEGGFLPAPVTLNQLLMSPAERMDTIMDFTGMAGKVVTLLNVGPDEPYNGGPFTPANALTTGKIMQFMVGPALSPDKSTPVARLGLPARAPLPAPSASVRMVSLNEMESATVLASTDIAGNIVEDCASGLPFGPQSALLGTMMVDGTGALMPMPMMWMEEITETPALGATEIWEIYNFTADAHPIHIHQVQFEVVERVDINGVGRPPEAWETGLKDTVIAYPGELTRIKAKFDIPGLFVWHCHIVEHEDNEMMRPYRVIP